MPKAPVFRIDGTKVGEEELPEIIFGVKPKMTLIWEAVKMYQHNQRQGTHHAKTRAEVKGSRRKIWSQKGLGRARHGDRYAPIFVGGGKAHGPRPKEYYYRLPKRELKLALKMILSDRASEEKIYLFENFDLNEIKTKNIASLLEKITLNGKKVLFVPAEQNKNLYLSARNIPNVEVMPATDINTLHVVSHEYILMEKSAVDKLKERLS